MTVPTTPSAEIEAVVAAQRKDFPFECELSLAPLIAYWNEISRDEGTPLGDLGRALRERLAAAPELTRPIADLDVLRQHRELVHLLMTVAFPPVFWEQDLAAALVPFHLRPAYMTPAF